MRAARGRARGASARLDSCPHWRLASHRAPPLPLNTARPCNRTAPLCRCIPVRYKGANGCADDVEVLLISSRGGKGWVFPKVR